MRKGDNACVFRLLQRSATVRHQETRILCLRDIWSVCHRHVQRQNNSGPTGVHSATSFWTNEWKSLHPNSLQLWQVLTERSGTAPKPPQQDLTDIKGTPIFFSPEIHQLPRGQGRGMLSFVEQHAMRRSGLFFPRRHVGVRHLHLYDVVQRLTVRRQFVHKHELWQCCRCSSFHEGRQHVEQGTLCH